MNKIGVDLGGTKTEAVLLGGDFGVLNRRRVPTPTDYDGIIGAVSSLVAEMSDGITEYSVGVCAPGTTSKETGLVKNSNTQCLTGRPLGRDLESKLGKKISMENDANCFAMAEARLGAAREFRSVFGVIMGTGVGGGIVIDQEWYRGRNGIAGEWGHHILHEGGNRCYCGKAGCVETYLSGPRLEERWTQLSGRTQRLPEILAGIDSDAGRKWKSEFLENFGRGLANVIDILDPDAIVIGGGLSNIDFLYAEGAESVYDGVFSDSARTPILKNALGDSAGVFGACML